MNIFQRNAKYVVVLAVLFASTSGIFSKLITANSMAIGFYRLTFALPVFVIPVMMKNWKDIVNLPKKDVLYTMFAGFFLFLHFACWFTAVKNTTIASGVVLAALHPIVVIFLGLLFFKKKVPILAVIGILLALFGGSLLAGFDYSYHAENTYGNLLALGAAIAMGIYFVIGNVLRSRINSGIYISILFATCWGLFLLSMLVSGTPFLGYPKSDWLWIIMATIFCQFGAHGLFNWAMAYVSSLFVSAWGTCEIVFAAILAYYIFHEVPTFWQIIGGIIVIVGLILYNYGEEGDS